MASVLKEMNTRYDRVKKGYPFGDNVFEFEGDLLDYILEQKKPDNPVVKQINIMRG
jgi:hypothetical protein